MPSALGTTAWLLALLTSKYENSFLVDVLSSDEIKEVDRKGFSEAYMKWAEASKRALSQPIELPEAHETRLIVLAGMGGSGIACGLIADWLRQSSDLPVIVVKDFHLPKCVNQRSLVFLISLSGETKETLGLLAEAVGRGCSVVAFSSGGTLEKTCRRIGIPHNRVESLMAPRASLPGMLYVPLRVLSELGLARNLRREADESVGALEETIARVSPLVGFRSNPAKKIAGSLYGLRPVVYSSSQHESVAYSFKASMNENAKVAVQVEAFPDLFHNEIETWTVRGNRVAVLLRHRKESEELRRRVRLMKALIQARGGRVVEVWCRGGLLASLVRWVLILDMVSIYVAVLNRRDPFPTSLVNRMRSI